MMVTECSKTGCGFILASQSPRRRMLMEQAGIKFDVIPPHIDEPTHLAAGLLPRQYAESLAYFKARSVKELYKDAVVLGADTIAIVDGEVLGKPIDQADARRMLGALSASRHKIVTGIALLGNGRRIITSDVTYVTMRAITPSEMDDYIESGEWRDKAGAYAIQETADRFVVAIAGSFSNIVGLPIELTQLAMKELAKHEQT